MIKFNTLSIDAESKYLTLDVSVNKVLSSEGIDYLQDIYISEIWLYTESTFDAKNFPSDNGILLWSSDDLTEGETGKQVNRIFEIETPMNIGFIYVLWSGTLTDGAPCTLRKQNNIGVVYNRQKLLKYSLGLLQDLGDSCEVNNNLVNEILKLKSFEIALQTGNLEQAIKYWNYFYNSKYGANLNCGYTGNSGTVTTLARPCGCHG